jgi:acetoin utilization protein AcuB
MLVKNWMSRDVITLDEKESMQTATRLMKENDIRMIPIMRENKLVGIITDRDLKRASASSATSLEVHELLYLLSKIRIKDIMTKNPITVREDLTVEETAEVLLENKISGVPVVDKDGKVVGTITQTDLFKVLISLTGVGSRGIQYALELDDRPGSIKEIADIMRSFGGRIVSIMSTSLGVAKGKRKVFIRGFGISRDNQGALKDQLDQKAKVLYMIDHRENRREIYD